MLRIGQLANRAGVGIQTLRYYERRGLLPRPDRSLGGHRLYDESDLARLRGIKGAQRVGFTLTEIADALGGRRARGSAGLHSRAEHKLADVEAEIDRLQCVATTLREAMTAGCDDLVVCGAAPACPLTDDVPIRRTFAV